jgi:hypothetical protein
MKGGDIMTKARIIKTAIMGIIGGIFMVDYAMKSVVNDKLKEGVVFDADDEMRDLIQGSDKIIIGLNGDRMTMDGYKKND